MKKRRRIADAAVGCLAAAFAALSYLFPARLPFLKKIELRTYDARAFLRQSVDPNPNITIIAIDAAALDHYGRWPWPRSILADLVNKIAAARPKVIALDVPFSHLEQEPGLDEIRELKSSYRALASRRRIVDRRRIFEQYLSSAAARLDGDARLAQAIASAGNVVLPVEASRVSEASRAAPIPILVSSSSFISELSSGAIKSGDSAPVSVAYPIDDFLRGAFSLGHGEMAPDSDGVVRKDLCVLPYQGREIPSYGLAAALAALSIKPAKATLFPGREIRFKNLAVPLDSGDKMLVTFNGPSRTFHRDSLKDVMDGVVPPDVFRNKIVFIGVVDRRVAARVRSPVSGGLSTIEAEANVAENILDGKFLERPRWAGNAELGLLFLAAILAIGVLPFLNLIWGAVLAMAALMALAAFGTYFFIKGFWIQIAYSGAVVIASYFGILARRLFAAMEGRERSAADVDREIGLSLRRHGLLDAAFEKFRACPLDRDVKTAIYGLADDFESAGEFKKAAKALAYLAARDSQSRVLRDKIKNLESRPEKPSAASAEPVRLLERADGNEGLSGPFMGGYQIEKDCGRWALGAVYRAREISTGRSVLLKTLEFQDNREEDEKTKDRFLADTRAASVLDHPSIARIMGAHEAPNGAFAAFEIAEGKVLAECASKDSLLPLEKIMECAALAADALDYAHGLGVLHRNLSPESIVLLDDGKIKLTDFGLASALVSSADLSGKESPAAALYISPEQAMGKKTDARSDIFSLGAALFELLTGQKPFKTEGGIGAVMFRIANDAHSNPLVINPSLPPCIVGIIAKALAKKPDERYARAALMAEDLRRCLAQVKQKANG
ncbi:MAG: CHASE2 domain-containing serine/threonine-protein kinase [Elusimicrobiota bacterium]